MPTQTLPWYPPAPAAAPRGFAHFHPDDWALEPKLDGCRILWWKYQPWTRQGKVLSASKGHDALFRLLDGTPYTIDGEWIQGQGQFIAFDIPSYAEYSYDDRRLKLEDAVMECINEPAVSFVPSVANNFAEAAAMFKDAGHEGYVLKKRASRYEKMARPGAETRSWLKWRFTW